MFLADILKFFTAIFYILVKMKEIAEKINCYKILNFSLKMKT